MRPTLIPILNRGFAAEGRSYNRYQSSSSRAFWKRLA